MARRAAILAVIGLFYFVLGSVLTWPLVSSLGEGVWGKTWDMWNNLWFFDQARHMSQVSGWSFQTQRVFFPFGYDLRADMAHFLLPLLSVPFQSLLVISVEEIFGLFLLFSLAFSGFAAFLLARRFTDSIAAAMVAGVLWVAHPVAIRELSSGSLEVACSGFFVLSFLALLRLSEKPTAPRAAVMVLFWLLTGFTNWVMAGMFGLVLLACAPFLVRRCEKGSRRPLAGFILASLAVTALVAWPIIGPLVVGDRLSINEGDPALARVSPSREVSQYIRQNTGDSIFTLINDSFDPGDLFVAQDAAVPVAPLLWWCVWGLALLGLRDARGKKLWLPILAGLFALLSCGPYLRWFNHFSFGPGQTPWPMPGWLLYKFLPGFHLFYRPYRFLLPAGLLLIGPTALGAARLLRRGGDGPHPEDGGRRILRGLLLVAAAVGLAFAGFQGSGGAFTNLDVPLEYQTIVMTEKPRALLEVPFFPLPVSQVNARAMFAQTRHRRPIFNATLLRAPGWLALSDFAESNSVIGALLDLQLKRGKEVRVLRRDAKALADMGFDMIIVHSTFAQDDPEIERYQRFPHELFLLMDRLFGEPQILSFGRLYRTSSLDDQGWVEVRKEEVARLRFERIYYRPETNLFPLGYVSLEIDGVSETLAVALPENAESTDHFCAWMRRKVVEGKPGPLFLEMGYQHEGEEKTWRTQVPLPRKPNWRWICLPLPSQKPLLEEAPFAPRRVTWLRFTSEGSVPSEGIAPFVLDMDDAAFVKMKTAEPLAGL